MPITQKQLNHKRIYINKNHNVMIKKTMYEAPDSELLLVKFEEAFLQGTNWGKANEAGTMGDENEDNTFSF